MLNDNNVITIKTYCTIVCAARFSNYYFFFNT